MINNPEFVENLAIILEEREIEIYCKIACRADKVTERVVQALKKIGCYEIHIGFESGSQKVLDSLNKGLTIEDNLRAAQIIRKADIKVYALMILG